MRGAGFAGVVLAAVVAAGCGGPERPAVLLLVVDTLRADHLGAYGHPGDGERSITPNVDALAAEGVVFERAIAASTRTAPAHASMLTSLRVREHSIGPINGATRLSDERPTLAEAFRDAGYDTAAFISNWVIAARVGLDRGFDVYDDEMTHRETNRADYFERPAPETAARAVAWLEARGDAPWFLWTHFQEPHGPYEPPPDYAERFAREDTDEEAPLPVLDRNEGWGGIPAYQVLPDARRPGEYRSRYAGEVAWVDHWIGRVVAAAERAAGERPLVVLFTADHGEALGEEDYWFAHGDVTWPSVAHVPLVLRAPGLAPERRRELAHHVDVLPTLLELAGLAAPEAARGLALGAYVRRGEPLPDRVLFADIGTEVGVFRGDRYSRVERHPGTGGRIRWADYTWRPGAGWTPAEPDAALRLETLDYVRLNRRMEPAPALDEDEVERLRALGYAE